MKRRYSDCIDCLPSPEYDQEIILPKKLRSQLSNHEFITAIQDTMLEFINKDGLKEIKKFKLARGENLVVIFFGLRNNYMDSISLAYDKIKTVFNAEVLGLSANINKHEFEFLVANGTSSIVKRFNVLDPNGGGIYPRDVILIFDAQGTKKLELPILMMGQYALDKPIVDILFDSLEGLNEDL